MKTTIIISIILLASFLTGIGQDKFDYSKDFKVILAKTKDSNNNLFYDKLLKRFKEDDSTLTRFEILSLLIGFTDKPAYKPYDILETERLIYKLNDEGKFKEAYDTANALLKIYPLSYQGLREMSYAHHKLGNKDSANYYLNLVAKIMSAMLHSGDGGSPETAMFALGPADGQHVIRGTGYGISTMGSGRDKNGNFLDILTATKGESSKKMHFNIQHAVLKMFGGKSVEDVMKEVDLQDKKKPRKKNN